MMASRLRPAELFVGGLLLALGLAEATRSGMPRLDRAELVLVAVATAAIIALSPRQPALSLAAVWSVGAWQAWADVQVLMVEVGFLAVLFATARWGRPVTVLLGGLSVPAAAVAAVWFAAARHYVPMGGVVDSRTLYDAATRLGDTWRAGAVLLGLGVLGVPWLAGLALRFSAGARDSRVSQVAAEQEAARAVRESEQAHEIARLRDDQARLARDVHDVVGHSLAVILAQAESAQYLADADTAKLKVTMDHIATSARSSLQDVRQVLSAGHDDQPVAAPLRPLEVLIEGVRSSGHEVVSRELGTPQPMPPELEVVAFRVLQEMLTNAIKHGRRDEPVFVERLWPDGSWAGELRIEVRNVSAETEAATEETQPLHTLGGAEDPAGQGLPGMRRRLEAAGGRLDVARRREPDGVTFTTTAWVPVRTVSR